MRRLSKETAGYRYDYFGDKLMELVFKNGKSVKLYKHGLFAKNYTSISEYERTAFKACESFERVVRFDVKYHSKELQTHNRSYNGTVETYRQILDFKSAISDKHNAGNKDIIISIKGLYL